jgi:hypothetical protein
VTGVIPFAGINVRLGIGVQVTPLSRDACTVNDTVVGEEEDGTIVNATLLLVASNTADDKVALGGWAAGGCPPPPEATALVQVVDAIAVGNDPEPPNADVHCTYAE